MESYEYMKLLFEIKPQEIINGYNLTNIAQNGKVYIDIQKGMYGISQSGRISHERLKNHLYKHGYKPVKFTPGLWNHKYIPISFTGKQHADNLIQELQ